MSADVVSDGRITCGLYVNIILGDYVRTILGLNRTNDSWILDPRVSGPNVYGPDGTPMGVGNQVSLEFNLVYRWHAVVSARDDTWTQGFTKKIFPGKDISKLTLEEFRLGLIAWNSTLDKDPSKRNLNMDLVIRDKVTGKFDDSTLIGILTESIEDCAGIGNLILR
jgi:hypothetical protein